MIIGSRLEKTVFTLYRKVGGVLPWRVRNRLGKLLYGKTKPKVLTVDLSGSCNLRCPSCPVGSIGQIHPSGLMDKALFTQIVRKARDEHGMRVVALHNWTEPFLHPDLPEFIRIVKAEGLVCAISSNLTIGRHIEEVMAAGPDFFRISLSGFRQESYGSTHVRGDIEEVKVHMQRVADALKAARNKGTCVTVFYHKYQHNLEEMEQMKAYAKALGFAWEETWAYYMSLEKVFALIEGRLSEEERDFVDNKLALPIGEAVAAAQGLKGHNRCTLLEDQIVLDYRGNVNLCCAVYEQGVNRLGNFMQMSADALTQSKSNHPTCKKCAGSNLHLYFTYYDIPELEKTYGELAQARVQKPDAGA